MVDFVRTRAYILYRFVQSTATLQGLSTIHAYHREKRFMHSFYNKLDMNTR